MKAEAKNLFGDSNIHYLGQEKSNSLRGLTEVVNIHYLGQIQNLGQNNYKLYVMTESNLPSLPTLIPWQNPNN